MVAMYRGAGTPGGAGMLYGRAFGGRVVHRLGEDAWDSPALCGYRPRSFQHWLERAEAPQRFQEPLCPRCRAREERAAQA